MRGRRPAGPEYVDRLEGSDLAKERLKIVLQTLAGQCRVTEACQHLGICEQRFHQIREEALTAALAGLEPQPAGRPAVVTAPTAAAQQTLQTQVEQLEVELRAAQARAEIALTLPRLVPATPAEAEAQKKTRPRTTSRPSRRRRPPRKTT
jgi:transposase-like protein